MNYEPDPLRHCMSLCVAGVNAAEYETWFLTNRMAYLEIRLAEAGDGDDCHNAMAAWRTSFQTFKEALEAMRTSTSSLANAVQRFADLLGRM